MSINFPASNLPDEAQQWRRKIEEELAAAKRQAGLGLAGAAAAAAERKALSNALSNANLTEEERRQEMKEARRAPAAPENPQATSDAFFDEYGYPRASVSASCDPVTLDTQEEPMTVKFYELHGKSETDTTSTWHKLGEAWPVDMEEEDGTITPGLPIFQHSPLPAGEDWSFKMRAVSAYDVPGEFSGQVTIRLAKDTTPPPQPAPPVGTSRLGQVSLEWSGKTSGGQSMPPDFSHAEVWIATTPTDAGKAIGKMGIEDTFYAPEQPYNVDRWYWLVAVDFAANRSLPSARVNVVTKPLVSDDIIGEVISEENLSQLVRDKITQAQTDADAAAQKAQTAIDEAIQAQIDADAAAAKADQAQIAANGKNRNFYYANEPSAATDGPFAVGDAWFDTDNGNKMSYWDGSRWAPALVGLEAVGTDVNGAISDAATAASNAQTTADQAKSDAATKSAEAEAAAKAYADAEAEAARLAAIAEASNDAAAKAAAAEAAAKAAAAADASAKANAARDQAIAVADKAQRAADFAQKTADGKNKIYRSPAEPIPERVNLFTNPSFEQGSGTVEVRRNLATNPLVEGLAGYVANFGTGGAGTFTNPTAALPARLGGGNGKVARLTWSTLPTGGIPNIAYAPSGQVGVAAAPGEVLTVQVSTRLGATRRQRLVVDFRGASGWISSALGDYLPGQAGVWQDHAVVTAPAPAGTTHAQIYVALEGLPPATGVGFDMVGMQIEKRRQALPFFAPGLPSPDTDLTPSWAGAANASESVLTGVGVAGVTPFNAVVIRSTRWAKEGSSSARIIPTGTSNNSGFSIGNGLLPKQATHIVTTWLERPVVNPSTMAGAVSRYSPVVMDQRPNTAGEYQHRLVSPASISGGTLEIRVGCAQGDGEMWVDALAIVEGNYAGPYFETFTQGDLWFKLNAAGTSVEAINVWNGAAWVPQVLYAQDIIAAGSITGTNIAAKAITAEKMAANSITAENAAIADAAISNAKIASLDAGKINTGTLDADRIAAESITAAKLAANAVTASKIEAGAVTAGKIGANAVTADNIAANSISASKLLIGDTENYIDNPRFDTGDLTGWEVVSGTWTLAGETASATGTDTQPAELRNGALLPVEAGTAVAYSDWTDNGGFAMLEGQYCMSGVRWLDQSKALISESAIYSTNYLGEEARNWTAPNGARYAQVFTRTNRFIRFSRPALYKRRSGELLIDGTINAWKIAANAIVTEKIDAGAVTALKIATNAVTADKIDAGAVTAVKLSANAVTADKLEANAITSKHTITGALIRTAATGDRTEMTTSGIRVIEGGVEQVRLGYGVSTGMSVRDPRANRLIPLGDHVFGITSANVVGNRGIAKPSATSSMDNPIWSAWTEWPWSEAAISHTGRVAVWGWGRIGDVNTQQNYTVQLRLRARRMDTGADLGWYAETIVNGFSAQSPIMGLVTGVPVGVPIAFTWYARTQMFYNSGTPVLSEIGYFAMPA